MIDNYEKELEELKNEYMIESEKALQETDKLYNEMVEKLGTKQFFSQSINKPIMDCGTKYRKKFDELKKKYNK